VLLTNHRGFAASTIAAVYRQRWQIELFDCARFGWSLSNLAALLSPTARDLRRRRKER
jgi:hypothetical protein